MQPLARNNTAVAHGTQEQAAFTIEMNAHLFDTLINGLYSDKVGSPMREVMTNARDGHAAAGCLNRPFDVQLPSVFDSTFSVRDYGSSLTHEQVLTLATRLGASSKRETNSETGMLGYGFKSPFAYTDQFTVICWKDDFERVYNCFIGKDGIPQVALLSSRNVTNVENGVKVMYPVKSKDVTTFHDLAKPLIAAFDPVPNVLNSDFQLPDLTPLMSGDGWVAMPQVYGDIYARMGSVIYPISLRDLPGYSFYTYEFDSAGLVIDFPIGSLAFAHSREALAYTEQTIAALTPRLIEIKAEIRARVEKEVGEQTTFAEAHKVYRRYRPFSNLIRSIWWQDKCLSLQERFDTRDIGMLFIIDQNGIPSFKRPGRYDTLFLKNLPHYKIVYEELGAKKGRERINRLLSDGILKEGDTVLWIRRSEPWIYADDYIDLSTVEPLNFPQAKTRRAKSYRRPGFSMMVRQPGNSSDLTKQTLVPDETFMFIDGYTYPNRDLFKLPITTFVVYDDKLQKRLKKAGHNLPFFTDHVAATLKSLKLSKVPYETNAWIRNTQGLYNTLMRPEFKISREAARFLKDYEYWRDISYSWKAYNNYIDEDVVKVVDLTDKWDAAQLSEKLSKRLPLLCDITRNLEHYLKLEGFVK